MLDDVVVFGAQWGCGDDGAGGARYGFDESLNGHHMNFVYPTQIASWEKKVGISVDTILNS